MKNKKLRSKIILGITCLTIINVLTLYLWFRLKIEPIISMTSNVKEEITNSELKEKYKTKDELLENINLIANKHNIKFSIIDSDKNELTNFETSDNNLFLFSKIVKVDNEIYIINAYLDRKSNTFHIVLELIIFQIFIVILFMSLIFIFARSKIIKPTEKIIENIRNYKLGKKPIKVLVKNEFDLIQNEFVNLVNDLEKEKEEQNRIIASISHDIKTPLTSIIGYSNLINDGKLNKGEIITYNKKIIDKSIHIKNLLSTFDEYIANQNNQLLKISELQIKDLIEGLNNDYKIELENNNIEFIIETSLNNEVLKVDILKMKRIFSNIISNSVRYIKENGIIKINITKQDDYFKFIISDNGIGVDEKIIEKIFDPLFTTDESRKISGLGLSICKEFVLMHGGTIKAYNNNGLSIMFTIPISR